LLLAQRVDFKKLKNLQEEAKHRSLWRSEWAKHKSTAISSSTTTVSITSGILGTQLASDEPISSPVARSENDNV